MKTSVNDYVIKACAKALKEVPACNSQVRAHAPTPCPTLLPEPTLARCVHLVRHVPQKKRGVESIQTVYNASIESSEQPDFFSTVRWFYHVKGQRQVSRPLSKTRLYFRSTLLVTAVVVEVLFVYV